ncbi:universal stress protein [Kribbella shirazensis]|uniref:Nucleotide-binding universal stress UspA family protein n=1 Tax=Kribbella shirazensis TaxID=1105143 RepID=A0A7X5VDV4_9ACTN|nr:universal stress protein [Kribbella shirazensis]NIK59189.1 nucleotide-binding universal stress UspA family protein [Kribbella shirazensis]
MKGTEVMNKYILVGVDDTPEAQIALRWAVEAAKQRELAVRIVRAYRADLEWWPAASMAGYVPPPMPLDMFHRELDEAVQYVRDRLGHEAASGWLADEDAAPALLMEAGGAEMVVLGGRSPSKMSAAFLGSVATAVAAKAPCPVVVVRGERRTGPIVVGTDGSPDSEDAVVFAFEEAARTGEPLRVVYCWQPMSENATSVDSTEGLLQNWLAESLEPYRRKFPTVRVRAAVLEGRASAQLIKMSAEASLVVVGSRGRGGVKGLLLGSVSQSLLHHADSPVAIVRRAKES